MLMEYFLSEIEPGFILMMIIWIFSSFFSKKKGKGKKTKKSILDSFESLMSKLEGIPNLDFEGKGNPLHEVDLEENLVYEFEDELEPTDSSSIETQIVQSESENLSSMVTAQEPKEVKRPKEIKLFGTPLQKAIVFKEILDKPRALRPHQF